MSLVQLAAASTAPALVVKGTLVLLVGSGVAMLLRRAAASARHLLWLSVIVGVLLVPVLARVAPMRVAMLPAVAQPVAAPEISATADAAAPASQPPARSGRIDVPAGHSDSLSPLSLSSVAFGVWLLTAAAFAAWLAAGMMSVRRILREARVIDSPEWARVLDEATRQVRIAASPRLLVSDQVETAFAWGLLAPTIVLPTSAAEWSDDRRRAVLLHELAHIRRRDLAAHVLAAGACALYWFHPLVWLAARRLRAESELACDDVVLASGVRPSDYAQHLLEIVAGIGPRQSAPALALPMIRSRDFEGRLQAILDRVGRRTLGTRRASALIGTMGLITVSVAAVVPVQRPSPARSRPVAPAPVAFVHMPAVAPASLPVASPPRRENSPRAAEPRPESATEAARSTDSLPSIPSRVEDVSSSVPVMGIARVACERAAGGQSPALVDSVYHRIFEGVALTADQESKACELLLALYIEQAMKDSLVDAAVQLNRARMDVIRTQRNVALRALLTTDAQRVDFDARVAQESAGFALGGRGRSGGSPPDWTGARIAGGGFGGGGGRGRQGGGSGGGGGGERGAISASTNPAGVAGRLDSTMVRLDVILASRMTDITYSRLLDGMGLTADQEAAARSIIIAAQQETRAGVLPPRVASLRLGPVPGIVAMQAAGAAQILALISNEADRAKVQSHIVIIQ